MMVAWWWWWCWAVHLVPIGTHGVADAAAAAIGVQRLKNQQGLVALLPCLPLPASQRALWLYFSPLLGFPSPLLSLCCSLLFLPSLALPFDLSVPSCSLLPFFFLPSCSTLLLPCYPADSRGSAQTCATRRTWNFIQGGSNGQKKEDTEKLFRLVELQTQEKVYFTPTSM